MVLSIPVVLEVYGIQVKESCVCACHKYKWGSVSIAALSLNLGIGCRQEITFTSWPNGEGAPSIQSVGGWVGPTTGLDTLEKISCPCWKMNEYSLVVHPVIKAV
jgi:hypothetical protein